MSAHHKNWMGSALRKLLKNKLATACAVFLVLEIAILALAPWIAPFSPDDTNISIRFAPGFWARFSHDPDVAAKYVPGHIFGTDHLGRDVFSRLIIGGRVSLTVGFVSTALGLVVGTVLGLLAGFYKRLDNPIMRVMDLLFTFPGILLAMLIVAMMGVSTVNAMLAISIWSIPNFARMVRGKVLQVKEEDYIMAIRATGAKNARIIFVHILKNCLPLIIVIATMRMASSIISISTLSYLGMGVPPPAPEWGSMIAQAKEYMWKMPSLIVVPGVAVMLTVISFNILGDKLRDILDPSLKD
ncbi:putative peptide transporter permease subunit: membrane component of ABC superfamily [uncultured spirochete]|uniref:Putative peptide transporter permease subunit: membrane component of ABC superfamily n=1 Tax=uncultured spirochete TaxID=156406 RepID=A0A3P3XRI0_9SPIR|nr:putative peptide transporter permease subunit: membrane component of ABC superfamily [uncultured spirochete]